MEECEDYNPEALLEDIEFFISENGGCNQPCEECWEPDCSFRLVEPESLLWISKYGYYARWEKAEKILYGSYVPKRFFIILGEEEEEEQKLIDKEKRLELLLRMRRRLELERKLSSISAKGFRLDNETIMECASDPKAYREILLKIKEGLKTPNEEQNWLEKEMAEAEIYLSLLENAKKVK